MESDDEIQNGYRLGLMDDRALDVEPSASICIFGRRVLSHAPILGTGRDSWHHHVLGSGNLRRVHIPLALAGTTAKTEPNGDGYQVAIGCKTASIAVPFFSWVTACHSFLCFCGTKRRRIAVARLFQASGSRRGGHRPL